MVSTFSLGNLYVKKDRILGSFLNSRPLDDTFIPPKVREFIQSQK